jgi:adenylosuccinate synthase
MPSEMENSTGDVIRERAWEYGTTTGRPRRVGWSDAVAGRYCNTINGFTSLIVTRLDVLDGLPSVKICVRYRVDGRETDDFPASTSVLKRCQPVYQELPGWDRPTASATSLDQLPQQALAYLRRIEELVGCPVHMVSTGPRREETILIKRIL